MRLIDKWIIWCRSNGIEVPSPPPVSFVVDNIARDYYHDERDEFSGNDFPYAIPPWPQCFVEWKIPNTRKINGCVESFAGVDFAGRDTGGAIVLQVELTGTVSDAITKLGLGFESDEERILAIQSATRLFVATPVFEIEGKTIIWGTYLVVFTTETGLATCYGVLGCDNFSEGLKRNLMSQMRTIFHVLGFAFTFANCKNVSLVDSTSELKPRDKIERRLRLPSFKRYTLKIDGKQTAMDDGNGNIESPAYHLCRGHFATYTPERPLFGRLHGKFWIPAHTRGNKSRGEVEKGYSA